MTPAAQEDLRSWLHHWLAAISAKVLAHEFALFRYERRSLADRLAPVPEGTDGRSLYRSFVGHLRGGDWAAVSEAYPEWDRLRSLVTDRWIARSIDVLARLEEDRPELGRVLFDGRSPGRVARILPLSDDRHDGGGTILALRFEGELQALYKPRPVGLERWFGDLLRALGDDRDGLSGFRTPEILDRGSYGWAEFISHRPCRTPEEVERFFRRAGALLAVFHGLGSVDCHLENLIADGDRPVLVDAETVLQAEPVPWEDGASIETPDRAGVLETGFLPDPARSGVADTSGLDGGRVPTPVEDVLTFRGMGSDDLVLQPGTVWSAPAQNGVRLGGERVDPEAYGAELELGFQAMYDRLVDVRSELLTGPLWRDAGRHTVRFLARSTTTYWLLVLASLEPRCLADGRERKEELDRLRAPLARCRAPERLGPLLDAEVTALWDLDVPSFRSPGESRDLPLAGRTLHAFFRESPLDRAARRLRALDSADRERQLEVIRRSLRAREAPPDDGVRGVSSHRS